MSSLIAEEKPPTKARLVPGWVGEAFGWGVAVIFLILALPLFLCMPLWFDSVAYGLCSQSILRGGIFERDVNNFFKPPMMAWILTGIEYLTGWRSVILRAVDLAFVGGIICLLAYWLRPVLRWRVARLWVAVAMTIFYFATTEWCHVQPDVWMLLPALVALFLRRRQTARLAAIDSPASGFLVWGLGEGIIWGAACLFKPVVILPGLFCWLLGTVLVWRTSAGAGRRLLADAFGLLVGGLLAGVVWVIWMRWDGGWSYFWEDVRVWSGGYYADSRSMPERIHYVVMQFWPWGLVHAAALVVTLTAICRALFGSWEPAMFRAPGRPFQQILLAGFYLGWFLQANFIQRQFDYHLVSTIFLALTLIAGGPWPGIGLANGKEGENSSAEGSPLLRSTLAVVFLMFLGLVLWHHPLLKGDRLSFWSRCLREGSSPEVRDGLSFEDRQAPPSWVDLARVASFLRTQGLRDGELTCYSQHTSHLYLELNLTPAVRFPLLDTVIYLFPDPEHQQLICRELNAGHQRLVVTDIQDAGLAMDAVIDVTVGQTLPLHDQLPLDMAKAFPWSEPIVFRSGTYLVHRVTTSPILELSRVWPETEEKN